MDKKNVLYGRRVLHCMSPVRWSGNVWQHHADSNFKVLWKTVNFLPDCHHFILVPELNEIGGDYIRKNVTWVPFPYPISVLANRGYFEYSALASFFDWRRYDIDFIFLHQPELFYNIMSGMLSRRYGTSIDTFLFFHWIDSPKSKPSETYTDGFWRQIEAIDLSAKTFIHSDVSINYLKDNWKRSRIAGEIIDTEIKKKITYMPLSPDPFPPSKPISLPKKKILVFNHRWNNSTGIKRLIEYTKDLSRDEYLIWVTDKNALHPTAGEAAPNWMRVESLPSRGEYRYLIENCFATLTFVDDYATWNLSVQDGIELGARSLVYEHPIMKYVLGDNYTQYFKTKSDFLSLLEMSPDKNKWKLPSPSHEEVFKNNLLSSMTECIKNYEDARKKEPHSLGDDREYSDGGQRLYGREWLQHIINGNGYKRNILYNTHRDLHLSNSWEHLRRWVIMMGAVDDPFDSDTHLEIRDDKKEEVQKLLDDPEWKNKKFCSEAKKDPKFIKISKKNMFETE